ncbi:MAG: penicillin-insensitive murein endopeptidase [Candidatus Binatia bacterium]
MKRAFAVPIAVGLALPVALSAREPRQSWTSAALWSAQAAPKAGAARAIGAAHGGCLQGAASLPAAGPGFELLHLGRRRYFGHPALVDYVRRLATAASQKHLPPLLIGDLSQARGGPTPTDHGSHQTGLDVDVSYTRPANALVRLLDPAERETLKFPPVVDLETLALTEAWNPGIATLLELAAADTAVDRIFVNPVIKRELCTSNERGTAWLAKLRPWRGHHDHFHVRLKCPDGSTDCRPTQPLPPGNGCDKTLTWWFSREARQRPRPALPSRVAKAPALPKRCRQLLD